MLTSVLVLIAFAADPAGIEPLVKTESVEQNALGVEWLVKVEGPYPNLSTGSRPAAKPDPAVILEGLLRQPVATVNGEEIPASAVLQRYGSVLLQAGSGSPEQYASTVRAMIESELRSKIEVAVLCQELARRYPAEQLAEACAALEQKFDETQIPKLQKELSAERPAALRAALSERCVSLNDLRQTYVRNALAVQAVREICGQNPEKEVVKKTIADLVAAASIQSAYDWKAKPDEKR